MSLPRDYFDRLYGRSDDPWRIATGWYERRKRDLVLASLPRARFGTAFEPGCGNGELTIELASRCTRLLAWDVVDAAVERTRERTRPLGNVEVRSGALPSYWPDETAELIVLSEVGYYLSAADLTHAVAGILDHLAPGGVLLGVHWRHEAPDYPLTGDRVHELITAHTGLDRLGGYLDADFVLDIWISGTASSVARQDGVR